MTEDLFDDETGEILLSKAQLEAVQIDELQLEDEFREVAAKLAYWNARYADANRRFLVERHELRIMEAQLWLEEREDAENEKPKPTVDDIKARVHTRKEYKAAHMRYVEADAEQLKMKKFSEAVSAKKDMLQSIGAFKRAEMEGDPVTRQQVRDSKRQGREED